MYHVRAKIRYCYHHNPFSVSIIHRYDQVIIVVYPFPVFPDAVHRSANLHLMSREKRTRSFNSGCRVMIACGNDDLHIRAHMSRICKKLIICCLGCSRRIAVIKDVSGNQQCVGTVLA